MGKKDKKEKKKKRKREDDRYSDEESYKRKYDKGYHVEDSRSNYENERKERKQRDKNVPLTEEYVYDYSGQEVMQSSRDMSISPERPTESKRMREMTPPPLPPGMDWPFEAPKAGSSRPKSPLPADPEWLVQENLNRDRDYQNEVDRKLREKQRDERRKEESANATNTSKGGGGDESLSVEETNKLRAKLGLKPLKVDGDSKGDEEKSYEDREDTHKPATNISQMKKADKMREKMEAIREKRKINKKLQRIKGLGAAEDDDPVIDSAAAWVAKSRMQAKEKEMAAKRAKLLEEMDDEFGVSDLIAETSMNIKKEPGYSSRDLQGLKVQHKGNAFAEGENTILTLQDKGILDEDDNEDVLVNVNIIDTEKANKNLKNKNQRAGYKAYDEEDDETGGLKIRGLLDKYDEEIDGAKKSSFRIDGSGRGNLEGENEMDQIRASLKAHQVSLELDAPQLARDYYTEEEMVKFKKPRKKVRKVVRKRNVLKADDLLKFDLDSNNDRGSRNKKSILKKNYNKKSEEVSMDIVTNVPDELDYFLALNQKEEDNRITVDEDEAQNELQLALQRSRRSKNKSNVKTEDGAAEKVAIELSNHPINEIKTESESYNTTKTKKKGRGMIVLDSTSEFCRTLGDLPTIGGPSTSKVEVDNSEDMEIEDVSEVKDKGGWEQVELTEGATIESKAKEEEDEDVLEPEPLPTSMTATLNLANMKGYLKDGREKVRRFDPLNLPETKAEVDTEKLRDEEKNRYNSRGYDRERYDPYAFKDKSNYKPDIKLEYVDGKGRSLNQKEAFRLLSWKFHGKGSGKLKTEKREKKIIEEKKLQKMSSIDTPLNTSAMFKDRQKQSQTPYLVLSGGGKNLLSGDGLKK